MTSFDQPDASLLVEHLLPSLLGASHSLSQELQERTLFFGELSMALEALHQRLTIISSPPREKGVTSQYPWLWRYVDHFTVGAKSRAVQHAKLWAFHWKANETEFIELHVSSTNLTSSAFKEQMQAGWQVLLQLGESPRKKNLRSWNTLVSFLEALGESAGEVAQNRIERLVTLLSRVQCPIGVTFIASIPGGKSAAHQLKEFRASEIHVLTPTIGEWDERTLSAWSTDIGIPLPKVHIKWISEMHLWAKRGGWALSNKASAALVESGVKLECLPNKPHFAPQHLDAHLRWSHAKLYLLRIGGKWRLLVTSANWSSSAWGAGAAKPRNFELGVVFETEWTELKMISQPFEPPHTVPFCVDCTEDDVHMSSLEWAEALWNGKSIKLIARSSDASMAITATIGFSVGSEEKLALVCGTAMKPWEDPMRTPTTARFTQGEETLDVNILDIRPPSEFARTPMPEVDPSAAQALREALLLQRYGGPAVDTESIASPDVTRQTSGAGAPAVNYSVKAWLDARIAFNVVNQWQNALDDAMSDPVLLDRVRLDGEELRTLYERREGPAAALVVEELDWRLNKEE